MARYQEVDKTWKVKIMKIRIFTDGACSKNPGPGGWAAVFNSDESCHTIQGNELETTNNRMELKAVVECLKYITRKYHGRKNGNCEDISVEIYSDSAYVVNAINGCWITKWKLGGWVTTSRNDVKNKDLWIELDGLLKTIMSSNSRTNDICVKFIKVKGHSGNTFNELVDKLAREETQKAKLAILRKAGDAK